MRTAVEPLENRTLLSVTSIFDPLTGDLDISSDADDAIIVTIDPATQEVLVNEQAVDDTGGGTVTTDELTSLDIEGGPADNVIDLSDLDPGTFPDLIDTDVSVSGGDGNDSAFGEDGDDTMLGGVGNDMLDGGLGNDDLDGFDGADQLIGGGGDDMLDGGIGDDFLNGGAGNDSASGGDGDDSLFGGAGSDQLSGEGGNDVVNGQGGNDTLAGGDGMDNMIGDDTEFDEDFEFPFDPSGDMPRRSRLSITIDVRSAGATLRGGLCDRGSVIPSRPRQNVGQETCPTSGRAGTGGSPLRNHRWSAVTRVVVG